MVLDIKNLNKSFHLKDKQTPILENLNLSIQEKDYVIIEGNSGSGKTTLINIILGFMTFDSGSVQLFDREVTEYSDTEFSNLRLKRVGYVSQDLTLISNFSVAENIMAPQYLVDQVTEFDLDYWLRYLYLDSVKNSDKAALSGGESKRVLILRSLVNNPDVLIWDEPTASLDSQSVQRLIQMLEELNQEKTIIIITHDDKLKSLGNKQYRLEDRKLTQIR